MKFVYFGGRARFLPGARNFIKPLTDNSMSDELKPFERGLDKTLIKRSNKYLSMKHRFNKLSSLRALLLFTFPTYALGLRLYSSRKRMSEQCYEVATAMFLLQLFKKPDLKGSGLVKKHLPLEFELL